MGRGVYRNYYKGHMEKIKREGEVRGMRWVWTRWAGGMGENADNSN